MRKDQGNGPEKAEAGEGKQPTDGATPKEMETPKKSAEVETSKDVSPEAKAEQEVPASKGVVVDADTEVKAVKQKMFRIIIDEQDNNDKNGLVRCTDGQSKQYTIERGHEVDVPEGVVNVLRESVYTTNEEVNNKTVTRNIPRYAMRIIKEL